MTGEKSDSSHCACLLFVAKRLECVRFSAAFFPFGTFENSQQHARMIYGWVHGPQSIQSPAGDDRNHFQSYQAESLFISLPTEAFAKAGGQIPEIAKRTQFSSQVIVIKREAKENFSIL
jgi:hypothetical protein